MAKKSTSRAKSAAARSPRKPSNVDNAFDTPVDYDGPDADQFDDVDCRDDYPDSDADDSAEVPVERRRDDRRKGADRRKKDQPVAKERRKLQRREKVNRRRQIDPTTCERDYTDDEVEFMNALDDYKRSSGRMFPTCSEILEVIRKIGYIKRDELAAGVWPTEQTPAPTVAEASAEAQSTTEHSTTEPSTVPAAPIAAPIDPVAIPSEGFTVPTA